MYKKLPAYLLMAFALTACGGPRPTTPTGPPEITLIEGYEYVHLIPDSIRTPEQWETFITLQEIILDYVKIENEHFVVTISKKDFLATGVPEPYYDLLIQNMAANNYFIDQGEMVVTQEHLDRDREKIIADLDRFKTQYLNR